MADGSWLGVLVAEAIVGVSVSDGDTVRVTVTVACVARAVVRGPPSFV
jgi:hypothetical protein